MKIHHLIPIPGSSLTASAGRYLLQLCRFAMAAIVGVTACVAHADSYPSKPIRVVVDAAPGSVNDVWVRRLAPHISASLGQPLVIENRVGAQGTIAVDAVANAAPDGYSVLYGGFSPLITYPSSGGSVRYDPRNDFSPAAITTIGYPTLAINSALGVRTLGELQTLARQRPEGLTCATSGQASVHHFACEMVARALGVRFRLIPYKSIVTAFQDGASGEIHLVPGFFSELSPYLQSGRLLGLAVLSNSRIPALPSVPTFAELGHANMELPAFSGFYFPAKTPQEAIRKMNLAVNQAMKQPDSAERLKFVGALTQAYTQDEFADFVRAEQAKWKRMSDEMAIKAAP